MIDSYDESGYIYKAIPDVEINNRIYLGKIILLSQCDSFVGGRTNGSLVSLALNGGKYKECYVYDQGMYP